MPDRVEAETLSSLIGSIYDCAVDPDLWDPTLDAIKLSIQGANAQLSLNNPSTGQMLLASSTGVEPYWLERQAQYAQDFHSLFETALRTGMLKVDEPFASTRIVTKEQLSRNRYYNEWAKPQGLCDSIGLIVMQEPTRVGSLGLGRHESVGEFSESDIGFVRLLAPHIRRAVCISNLLDMANIAASKFEATIDALNVGVVLVDSAGRVVHANNQAQSLMSDGAVRLDNGALSASLPNSSKSLALAIAAAADNEAGIGSQGIGVPLSDGNGENTQIAHVLPLPASRPRRNWMPGATAAIFLTPNSAAAVPLEALASLYDFTPAEAKVLSLLATGKTVAEISEGLGIAEPTVRTHVARILSKTGTGRQGELIQLIASLIPPVAKR